jgi:putative ABC transport system substrate-binding protein
MKVDVIQTAGDFALRIAQQATSTISIVANSDDMLGTGLIPSLAPPGGNTTGLTILSPELSGKRLQSLRDFMPALLRVASLWDPTTGASQVTQTESAAQSMQIKLQVLEVRRGEDLVDVGVVGDFTAGRSSRSPLNTASRKRPSSVMPPYSISA